LPVSTPRAIGEYGTTPTVVRARRQDLDFRPAFIALYIRLADDRRSTPSSSHTRTIRRCAAAEVRDAEVPDHSPAIRSPIVEIGARSGNSGLSRVHVVEVDVIGLQPLEARLDRAHHPDRE
jgi:hypothetical protein